MSGRRSKPQEDVRFRILHLLQINSEMSQRELAVGISVGSVHYLPNTLVEMGPVKFGNFTAARDKRRYAHILTSDGLSEMARLTVQFLRRKMAEYEALKAEISQLQVELETDGSETIL